MTSITIFSAPKPFTDPHIDLIQRNAIQSWQRAGDDVEVILVGEEDGLAEVAAEYGVRHLPNVARNHLNTPLVSSIFQLAREASDSELLVYINADIILFPDFEELVQQVAGQGDDFLAVGRRWDLDIRTSLDFTSNWAEDLKVEAHARGQLQRSVAIDYFIFPRNLFLQIPDFAIGRAGWDNWMIYHACEQNWPVIDLSPSLMIIHQQHDYNHLPGGQAHYDLEESHVNVALGGGKQNAYTILEANREFVAGRVRRPRWRWTRLLRRAERWMVSREPQGKRWNISRRLRKAWVKLEQKGL